MGKKGNIKGLTGMFPTTSRQGRKMMIGTSEGQYVKGILESFYESAVAMGIPEDEKKKLGQALKYVSQVVVNREIGLTFFLTKWASDEPPKLAVSAADPERQKKRGKKKGDGFFGDDEPETEPKEEDPFGDNSATEPEENSDTLFG